MFDFVENRITDERVCEETVETYEGVEWWKVKEFGWHAS